MYKGKFAKYYDDIYGNKDYIGESKILEKYCNLDRVLDVGCGTGAHLRKLYKKGRVLHGLDVSEDMISIAKEKFKDNKDITLYNLDVTTFEEMVDLPKKKPFTTIISMFNVVNHVLHRQQIGGFFESCSNLLEDGGTFVFDCFNEDAVNKEKPQPYVRGVASQIAGGSYQITSTPTFNDGTASLKLENKVDVYNLDEVVDQFTYRLDHIIWSQRFFKELIKKHQMKVEKILSNEEDKEATVDNYKIRFICKK